MCLGGARGGRATSSAGLLLGGFAAGEAGRPSATPGLDLITASVDLMSAEADLGTFRNRDGRLRAALAPLAAAYDFIFLDCPSSLSLLPVNAVIASDAFVVPAMPQFLAVAGVQN